MSAPPLPLNAWLRWDVIQRELHGPRRSVLELGAGQGAVAARLAASHDYVGVEPDPTSRATAAARLEGRGRLLADVTELPSDEQFDVVCAFEVIEHLEDHVQLVTQWCRHLAPGGRLLLSVPAHQHRFAAYDTVAGHLRRYSRAELAAVAEAAGLTVERIDAVGFPLGFPLEWARNLIGRRRLRRGAADRAVADRTASSGRTLQPPAWSGRLTQLATAPFRWVQRWFRGSELATGWVLVARRPASSG
ncbi:MAG: class I SAM-dependent methyltransferase [Acidimicrobiia bacterium]|jgi:SAM-dependent methyltransferase